jgi:hypothetical protein
MEIHAYVRFVVKMLENPPNITNDVVDNNSNSNSNNGITTMLLLLR